MDEQRLSVSYVDGRLDDFLDLVAARAPAPGGGAVAAMTVSLAASLVAMAGRYSVSQLPGSEQLVSDAERWRHRAAELADADAKAYREVIAAQEGMRGAEGADRRERLRVVLHRAAEVPLDITVLGAATATAGAAFVVEGNERLRGDAAVGVLLADAAVRSAAHLVAINVRSGGCDCDEDLVRAAARNVQLAADAVRSAEAVLAGDCDAG